MFTHVILRLIRVYFKSIKLISLIVCVTASLLFLASKYHDNVLKSVKNLCHSIIPNKNHNNDDMDKKCLIPLYDIILADSPEKCDDAVQRIRRNSYNGVLDSDCEWVNEGRISLLQLATYNGVCPLFRLKKIGYVSPKLKELLPNDCILKVGVTSFKDGRQLTNDYDCRVFGAVDLRTLVDSLGLRRHKSLAALCMQYLNIKL